MTDGSRTAEIVLKGLKVVLLSEKALFIPELKTLVIADFHLGKAAHFRKHGIYVPPFEELKQLQRVCGMYHPDQVIFLGDLFHSTENESVSFFREWSAGQEFSRMLVQGNHDILPCELYASMGMGCVKELRVGELLLLHDRDLNRSEFTIYGHVHPAVTILGKGRQGVSLPAFILSPNSLVMPAFGEFTGKYVVDRNGDNIIFALTGDRIFPIK